MKEAGLGTYSIDWYWIKKLIVANDWEYLEEYYSSWRNSTWYWSSGEGYGNYRKAKVLYQEGKWRVR